jgi:hypothetical protein
MASIGSTVSTRADTAARHTQACRINYEHLLMMNNADESEFLNNKYKYCMHKDELAVSLAQPMFPEDALQGTQKYPYPSVVTTLGDITPEVQNFICWSNHLSSQVNYTTVIAHAKNAIRDPKAKNQVENIKEYLPIGYSVGLAYAHPSSGDNIATVMTGGVITIPNGHFQMNTGDMVQFYWDFEAKMFNAKGERHMGFPTLEEVAGIGVFRADADNNNTAKRQCFQDKRQNGMNKETRKVNIPMIKPYVRQRGKQVFADNTRVFAKCVSCARPFDMVDIMICRQAM